MLRRENQLDSVDHMGIYNTFQRIKKKNTFISIVVHVKYDLRKFSKYYQDALQKMSSFNKILLRRHSTDILLGTGDVAVNKTRSLP